MKRVLGIALMLSLVGALSLLAQEVKPGKTGVIDLGNDVKLEMVLIPAGKFIMGSPASEKGHRAFENQHEVTLTKPFYIGKYEVTQEQWKEIMGANPSEIKGAKLPVTDVSWEDCLEFIKKLNAKTGGGCRLPTEAEWEYACRAGTTTAYSFGDTITPIDANYRNSMKIKPVAVGSYKPNAFGLYDMHGNVWEWCDDWKADYPAGAVTDPKGPATGERRVLRGGCFIDDALYLRAAKQNANSPTARNHGYYGFRLVRTIDSKPANAAPTVPKPGSPESTQATKGLLVTPFTETKAKEAQKELAKSLQSEVEEKAELGKDVNLEMVLIPVGKFQMGSPASEKGRFDNETQHEVTLTKPFYIGKYEITQEQWETVMGNNPSSTKGAKLPVINVSWHACQEFIRKLNAKTNGGFRLPTEAEWEYACRAGTTTVYSFGDNITKSDANYKDSKIYRPVAVGSYKPNGFGLHDMHGNVFEWCEDWKADYLGEAVTDPKGPGTGEFRVLRGGAFFSDDSFMRPSYRHVNWPTIRVDTFGLRLAKTAETKSAVTESTVPKPSFTDLISANKNLLLSPFNEAKAKEAQKEVAKSLQREVEDKVELGKGVNLEMVLIPTGKFMMGSPATEKGRSDNETQHEVTLTKPFYMGKYEVTQEQWEAVMGNNPSRIKRARLPVTKVSWEDCQEFIKKLNSKTDGGYRLPTEAEWEYACRAGTTTVYSFGDKITESDANYGSSTAMAVGSYESNAFGLYDMHGNVSEWCEDWGGAYPSGSVTDPEGPATGEYRVLRGGFFIFNESGIRSSNRSSFLPIEGNDHRGLRLAKTADIKAGALLIPKTNPNVIIPAKRNLLVAPFTEAKAKEVQKELAKSLKQEVEEKANLGKGINLEIVLIPAGKFFMGSPHNEWGRSANEMEQNGVTLTKPFYMGKYEITQEQWEAVMGNNPSETEGAKLPVTRVSWDDCQDFIKKLNAKTDGGYRLPTEAEWEYACRAGTKTRFSFGDYITPKDANYDDSKIGKPVAVGSYKPNYFGLYDMHGNVCEWCEDWFGSPELLAVKATDPKGPATGKARVTHGGGFNFSHSALRSADRGLAWSPTSHLNFLGFRLAKTADIKAGASLTAPKPDPTVITPATNGLLVAPFTEAKAKEAQKEIAKVLQKEVEEKADLGKGVNLEMVLIPAGKFMMGSPESEKGRSDNETQHEVTIAKPFYMAKYEVTQEQWEAVMGVNPSYTKGAKLPVTDVSWEDCQDFIKKLNASTKGGYRLPYEAEFEYSCRAGTSTAYSVGGSLTKADANIDGDSIKAVGSYKPNAFGLYDMHGNVWEWCEDWNGDYPKGAVTDPKGPATGERRVLRGGSFIIFTESKARSSCRNDLTPTYRNLNVGLRLARTADIKAAVAEPAAPKLNSTELTPATRNLLVAPFTETKAKEAQKEVAKSLQKEVEDKVELGKGIKLEMVLIPAGKFQMGSPQKEEGRRDDEPQHVVTLTKPYYMGKYEVTQEQYEAVMGNSPSIRTKGAKLPVTDVSWEECQEFIKKLNASTNGGYRLPTEAEWEYACRAGTRTTYSFGDTLTKSDANIDDSSIKAVGSYKPNAFGLYDMQGNVWEWCEDRIADYPAVPVTDPKGAATGMYRMLRGGSFDLGVSRARSSVRFDSPQSGRAANYGFRLVKTADIKAGASLTAPNPDPAGVKLAVGNLLVAPFTETKAKEAQKEVAKILRKEVEEKADLGKGIKLELVLIPTGKFIMGSPESEKGLSTNEKQHEVTFTKPFYMGKHEVTQEQWEAVMGKNPSDTKGAKLPVTDVSWDDCQEFIKKLNASTKGGYRLPYEGEWEYACRAGTSTAYSFGVEITPKDANYRDSNIGKPVAVGSYKPNAFGLYDMHGNVFEWCEDWYGNYPAGSATDPKGPATGKNRVLRGGSFFNYDSNVRSSFQNNLTPSNRLFFNGFRLARNP